MSDEPQSPATGPRLDVPTLLVGAVILLVPIPRILTILDRRPGHEFEQHSVIVLVDLALAGLVLSQVRRLPELVRAWRRHVAAASAVALALLLVPALVHAPSDRGWMVLFHLVGVAAVAAAWPDAGTTAHRAVTGVATAVLAAIGLIALLQRATGGPIGLRRLGEDARGVLLIGGGEAPFALSRYPYTFAVMCTIGGLGLLVQHVRAEDPRPWRSACLAVACAPIGLTMSRTALVAAVLGSLLILVVARRSPNPRRALVALGVVGVAMLLGVAWNVEGWAGRAKTSGVGGGTAASRRTLLTQAEHLFRDDPLLGVGPGRYVLALEERPELVALSPEEPQPVHNVPLLIAVQGGVVVIPGLLLLVAAVVDRARRAGPPGWALVALFVPFALLDHALWSNPQGLVVTALWLGWLDAAAEAQ